MASVRYLVHDVDAAIAFYVEQLGFRLATHMGTAFAIVERDDLVLWLSGPAELRRAADAGRDAARAGRLEPSRPRGRRRPGRGRAPQAAGVAFRNTPLTGLGGTQVVLEDPSGNAIELFSPR